MLKWIQCLQDIGPYYNAKRCKNEAKYMQSDDNGRFPVCAEHADMWKTLSYPDEKDLERWGRY